MRGSGLRGGLLTGQLANHAGGLFLRKTTLEVGGEQGTLGGRGTLEVGGEQGTLEVEVP